jgi:hypothetical protein
MGVAVTFHGADDGDNGPFDLASTGAWTEFIKWIETLQPIDNPQLTALAVDGEVKGTGALAVELEAALQLHPREAPNQTAAAAVGHALAELMGVGDPDETATITD